jgi:hypothetical protein
MRALALLGEPPPNRTPNGKGKESAWGRLPVQAFWPGGKLLFGLCPNQCENRFKALEVCSPARTDALLAKPARQLRLLSRDDRMEICRGFDWRSLTTKLIALELLAARGRIKSQAGQT